MKRGREDREDKRRGQDRTRRVFFSLTYGFLKSKESADLRRLFVDFVHCGLKGLSTRRWLSFLLDNLFGVHSDVMILAAAADAVSFA